MSAAVIELGANVISLTKRRSAFSFFGGLGGFEIVYIFLSLYFV